MQAAPDLLSHVSAQDRREWDAAWSAIDDIAIPPGLCCVSLSLDDANARIIRLRRAGHRLLALSTSAQVRERAAALDLGIDEFLQTGPIDPSDLRARLTLLEKGSALPDTMEFEAPDTLRLAGNRIELRERGARVFALLWAAGGGFVTHETLLAKTWGAHAVQRREYLRVAIGHMRNAIEPEPDMPRYILSEPGIGYRLGDGTPPRYIP